jgi:Domain of unknown function (DUF4926)
MPKTIHELDVVALIRDLPDAGLVRGQVGTVVTVLAPDAWEVEFVDTAGRTYGLITAKSSDVLLLHHDPVAAV